MPVFFTYDHNNDKNASLTLQVCWEKFTRYFDVEERFVHLTNDCFVLTPEKAIALVDENTIGTLLTLLPLG